MPTIHFSFGTADLVFYLIIIHTYTCIHVRTCSIYLHAHTTAFTCTCIYVHVFLTVAIIARVIFLSSSKQLSLNVHIRTYMYVLSLHIGVYSRTYMYYLCSTGLQVSEQPSNIYCTSMYIHVLCTYILCTFAGAYMWMQVNCNCIYSYSIHVCLCSQVMYM